MGFGPEADLLDARDAVDEEFIDFGRPDRVDLEAEGNAVDSPCGVEVPNRIEFGLGQPGAVQPLGLSPHIAHDVVREGLADGVGWRGQAFHQIGQFVFRQIELDILAPECNASRKQDDEKEEGFFHGKRLTSCKDGKKTVYL